MKTSRKGMLMAALICGTVAPVLFSGSAYAAETEEKAADEVLSAFELNPMVITAQRIDTSDLETPASTSVITAADIERSGAKTAYEIIERQVGLTNNAYGPGGREYGGSSSRIVMRGLDKGTLVLVNGAPYNLMNYNSTEGIPAQAIEKIEIVRGAQAALYGAEAVGGVINIITKKGGPNKTTISYGAGNYDQKWAISTSGKNYMAYLSKDYFGDVDRTNKIFEKSTRKWKLRNSTKDNAFVSFSPIDKLSIQWAHTKGRFYRDSWTRSTATGELTGKGTTYYYPETRDNVSAIYDDKENMFKSIIAYNRRRVDPRQGDIEDWKHGTMKWNNSSHWDLNSWTWDTQKGWKLRGDKDTFVVGFDFQKETAKTYNKDYSSNKGDRKTYALYASYKYQFSPKFSTTLGMRAMHVDDYGDDQNKFLPQFQTLYKANDKTSWYVNIGKSFEMPALNQYFDREGIESVEPQEGWTYETGVKVINKANSWKFDVFHMDIDGKFEWKYRDPSNPRTAYLTNVGNWKNTGAELEYTQNVNDNLKMRLGLMWANPKSKENDDSPYVQDEAKLQLTAGVDYQIGKFTANLNYLFVGKRQDSYYNKLGQSAKTYGYDHKVPNRSLLNAAFTYKADEHHSMQLTMNNILGRNDTINKYENWSMPYNWMLTYNYTF